MLRPGSNHFIWKYETNMCGGNRQWADPEEAQQIGRTVAHVLIDRHGSTSEDDGDSPCVREEAASIFDNALKVINYAALPTERRANILHGVVDALAEAGVLGGEPEWAPIPTVAEKGVEA